MVPPMEQGQTKTDREMSNRILAVQDDPERVDALSKARAFKRSWIELAEALSGIFDRGAWDPWGYASFEDYCRKELHVNKATAAKLLGSFRFLKTSAPMIIERAHAQPEAHVPSLRAIDFVARAEKRGAADPAAMKEIRTAAFDEGAEAPALTKRYKEVAFPVSNEQRRGRLQGQLANTGKRLASLIADPECPLEQAVAARLEEALGQMLAALHVSGKKPSAPN